MRAVKVQLRIYLSDSKIVLSKNLRLNNIYTFRSKSSHKMQMLLYSIEKIECVINEIKLPNDNTFEYEYQLTSIYNWQVWEDSDNIHS